MDIGCQGNAVIMLQTLRFIPPYALRPDLAGKFGVDVASPSAARYDATLRLRYRHVRGAEHELVIQAHENRQGCAEARLMPYTLYWAAHTARTSLGPGRQQPADWQQSARGA